MKKIKFFIKLLLSIGLIFFVLYQIDTDRLFLLLKKIDPFYIFLGFIFFNISKIISALRLNYYFKEVGIDLNFFTNLKLYYLGMFYNLFLPGGIGGDGYKIYLLKKFKDCSYKDLVTITLLDRVSGLVGLLFLGAIFFLFSSFSQILPLKILAILTLILSYPIFLIFHKKLFKKYSNYLKETTILGFFVQFFQLISAVFIILALPSISNAIDYITLFFISSIVAVLPITIGGVGAREATFLYGLNYINQDPSKGVAFSLLFFLITLISSAIGIFFINISKHLSKTK